MSVADEFPIGSKWRDSATGLVHTVLATVTTGNGRQCVVSETKGGSYVNVYLADVVRTWRRLVPEPKFKPGDRVTWGVGCDSFVVLASWVHPTTGETYMATTLNPTHAEWVGSRDGLRLVEDGAA